MIDYTIFYKTQMPLHSPWNESEWDLFISAYSPTERVISTYNKVSAKHKHWLIFPEYGYTDAELPSSPHFISLNRNEAEFIASYWQWANEMGALTGNKVCLDITGFIRPYLIFFVKWLKENGINKFDVIYSEPKFYSKREDTVFSDSNVLEVKQVPGFEGIHIPDTSKDVMIIGVGYEEHLIAHASESKENSRKIQLFGFPSLSADMFQENVIKVQKAEEEVGAEAETFFAPANDPFVTANVIKDIVNDLKAHNSVTNLYLCPIATKPQTLGFSIYYIKECQGMPVSIIFPYSELYSKETSSGILKIWKYTIEL